MSLNTPVSLIDGKYRVERTLGGGSFSEVFVVTAGRGRRSALKLLKKGFSGETSPEAVSDFKNEFSILKNLNHPNIARILDFGYDTHLKQYYYTSELVDGSNIFESTAGRPVEFVLGLFVQTLRAFHYLHSYRVYHFDVKAANILVAREGTVKVIDFGLASIDPKGKMIGTPSYMAPEIIAKERPDGRADLYSLGVLFYYCLARSNPFRGSSVSETLKNQQTLIPSPLSSVCKNTPPFLGSMVVRLLEKNPANRYQRAEEVLREIHLYAPGKFPMETRETLLSYLPEEGRLIGRKNETELFQKSFERVFSPTSPERFLILPITGGKGVGKTRFLRECKYFSQLHGVEVFSCSARDSSEWDLWLEKVRHHPDEGKASVFLLDDIDFWVHTSETFQRLRAALYRLAAGLEDLPPCLFLITSQNEEGFVGAVPPLKLGPFSETELKEYVTSLTGLEDPPKDILSGLSARTEGNPLLVTELLRSLIEKGALFDRAGRWKKTTFEDLGIDFSKARFSSLLEEILLARYEGLPSPLKNLLEIFSIAPAPLRFHEIERVAGEEKLVSHLEELISRELLIRDEPFGGYRIKNASLSELIYQKIPEKRTRFHDQVASLYAEDSEERLHHEIRGSDLAKAFALCRKKGEKLLSEARGKEAADLFRFALQLPMARVLGQEIDLHLKLGEALLFSLDYPEALKVLSRVEEILSGLKERIENVHGQVDALLKIGVVYLRMGEVERARNSFAAASGLLHFLKGDRVRELQTENFQGAILLQEGRLQEARTLFEKTRRLWEKELSLEEKEKVTNNDLGLVSLGAQEFPQALRQFSADLSFYEKLKDRLLMARTHYNLGQTYLGLKELQKAADHYEKSAEIAQPLRNTEFLLRAYNGLGNVYNLLGRPEEAIRYYERGLDLCERTGDLRSHAAILVNIAIIEVTLNQFEKARRRLSPAVQFLRSIPNRLALDWQILVRALLEEGDIARREKRWREAERILREALALTEENEGARSLRFWILHTLSEMYLEKGETEEAGRLLPEIKASAQTPEQIEKVSDISESINQSMRGESAPVPAAFQGDPMKNPFAYILEINKFINAETDPPFVLKTVLNYALELSQAEGGLILLLNEKGDLEVRASRNLGSENEISEISRSIARKVLETGEWIRTEDAAKDSRFQAEASIAHLQLKSVLCFPIRSKRKTIGVIYLDNRLLPNAFDHVDLEVLKAFADQAGIAIENARLLEGYESKKKELETRVDEISSRLEQFQSLAQVSSRGVETKYRYDQIIGRSKPTLEILKLLDKITDTDLSVFIHGESGTGKELIARALHYNSARSAKRFVALNCGAIPANLMESELFGYKAGAFTGAARDKKGLFEEADGGTLFLDEVAEIDPTLQAKLLRMAQEGEFIRVGDTQSRKVDVRLLSASNKDIQNLVGEKKFREDLFYRLCQIRIDLPALRERREDIPLLVSHFVKQEAGKSMKVSTRLMKAFLEYDWPGNVRELENLVKVAVALSEGGVIDTKAIPSNYGIARLLGSTGRASSTSKESPHPGTGGPTVMIDDKNRFDPKKSWYDYEKVILAKAYQASGFNAGKAATILGIAPATIYKKLKELGLSQSAHPLYEDPFRYDPEKKLKDYLKPLFQAALKYHGDKPYTAIAHLKVSQGYFYKVIKGC